MYMHAKSKSILIQLDAWESGVQWIARLLLIHISHQYRSWPQAHQSGSRTY